MKKIIAVILAVLTISALFAGCAGNTQQSSTNSESKSAASEKLSVVTTIFPVYDWVKEITNGSGNIDLKMLIDNGVDLHNFQPTANDIRTISECDVFVYVGGESDKWVQDALKGAVNKNMVVINLLESLGSAAKEEEVVEGMQADHEHEESEESHTGEEEKHDESGEAHDKEEEHELDEHVWLSLKNAQALCGVITEKLSGVDSANKELYSKNNTAYCEKLKKLDGEYKTAADSAKFKTVVFGDRFPFRYLVDDYGLSYYAAFAGCSAESEASFETIVFLSKKIDELGLKSILQIENANGSIAKTIKENTKTKDQEILTLNSLQSTTAADVQKGTTYLSVMTDNLSVLKKAIAAK